MDTYGCSFPHVLPCSAIFGPWILMANHRPPLNWAHLFLYQRLHRHGFIQKPHADVKDFTHLVLHNSCHPLIRIVDAIGAFLLVVGKNGYTI